MLELPWKIQLSDIFRAQSGFRYTASAKVPLDQDGNGNFNGRDLKTGRNAFIAPPFVNMDLRIARTWVIREHVRVQGMFEFFNFFIFAVIVAAWIEVALAGEPYVPPVPQVYPNNFAGPHGFPAWVRYAHFFNFFFLMLLIRSGISILMDHPRLYFNDGCTPGSEWIRFTPIKVPRDRLWTAKDDARYITPIVGTPGYRHTIGIARVWHFIDVHGFIVTGIFFVVMLLTTEQWRRIVPTSGLVLLQGWNIFVHYATLNLPPEPNGFYGYNALQQIAYFTVVFVFGPLAILTGIAMSPAVVNRFPWYARLFGGRQSARSIHFLTMLSFFAFLVVHVTLVVITGFARNMNHIVM